MRPSSLVHVVRSQMAGKASGKQTIIGRPRVQFSRAADRPLYLALPYLASHMPSIIPHVTSTPPSRMQSNTAKSHAVLRLLPLRSHLDFPATTQRVLNHVSLFTPFTPSSTSQTPPSPCLHVDSPTPYISLRVIALPQPTHKGICKGMHKHAHTDPHTGRRLGLIGCLVCNACMSNVRSIGRPF